jgi:hypothetical protein
MLTPSRIRNIAFVVIWFIILWYLYRPDKIEIKGCKYEKHTEPSGESWLIHDPECKCTSKMDQRQFEFMNC